MVCVVGAPTSRQLAEEATNSTPDGVKKGTSVWVGRSGKQGAPSPSSARRAARVPRHVPAAVPGSSPPTVPPSAGASPRCCRASPRPVGKDNVSPTGGPIRATCCAPAGPATSATCSVQGSHTARQGGLSSCPDRTLCGHTRHSAKHQATEAQPGHRRPLPAQRGLSAARPGRGLSPGLAQHRQQEAASSKEPRARATFLSWEVSSNSLASLAAQLPEDKRSGYKADQGQKR